MHLHSNYSDGKNSLSEIANIAYKLGYKKICFTDHTWKSSTWIDKYISEIKELNLYYLNKMEISIGFESKVLDFSGNLDINDLYLNNLNYQIVAAIHRIPKDNGCFFSKEEVINQPSLAYECYLKSLLGLKKNNRINRFAHPTNLLGVINVDHRFWSILDDIYSNTQIQLELNFKYDFSYIPRFFFEKFRNKIVVGSDSHSIEEFKSRSKLIINFFNKL